MFLSLISNRVNALYATTNYNEAWGPKGEPSYMSSAMIKLLGENLSMDELITRLREEVASEIQCPASFSAISKRVNLKKEFDEASKY